MFFLAIPALPVLFEVVVSAVVATIATKATSDVYDYVVHGDQSNIGKSDTTS